MTPIMPELKRVINTSGRLDAPYRVIRKIVRGNFISSRVYQILLPGLPDKLCAGAFYNVGSNFHDIVLKIYFELYKKSRWNQ